MFKMKLTSLMNVEHNSLCNNTWQISTVCDFIMKREQANTIHVDCHYQMMQSNQELHIIYEMYINEHRKPESQTSLINPIFC